MTVTSLWKCNELTVTQQELLRYYSNATQDLTCHNIYFVTYCKLFPFSFIIHSAVKFNFCLQQNLACMKIEVLYH
jgi:hypothetical protein